MEIIEQKRIRQRFQKAQSTYDAHAEAQKQICSHLADILSRYADRPFDRALEIGCGSGALTQQLRLRNEINEWTLNDLCDTWIDAVNRIFPLASPPLFLAGDAEKITFRGNFDLIASASAVQWMKDLPLFFRKLSNLLNDQGVLLFNTFTPNNLHEVKAITGEGLTYPTTERIEEWLAPDFRILHLEEDEIPLYFEHPLDVLRHLKYTGVTANASITWTRGKQAAFCQQYKERFSNKNNQVTLTYRPLYLLAIRK